MKKIAAGGGIEGENIQVHTVKLDRAHGWLRRRSRAKAQIDCKVFAGLYFATQARAH